MVMVIVKVGLQTNMHWTQFRFFTDSDTGDKHVASLLVVPEKIQVKGKESQVSDFEN